MADDSKGGVAFVVPVLRVEAVGFGLSNVPLRVGRIGVSTSSHADGTVDVREVLVMFQRNGFPRAAAPARRARSGIDTDRLAGGVAGLSDEIVDDAVEKHPVVEPGFNVSNHVVRGNGRPLFKQLDDHHALFAVGGPLALIGDVHRNHGIPGVGLHHRGIFGVGPVGPLSRIEPHASPCWLVLVNVNGG